MCKASGGNQPALGGRAPGRGRLAGAGAATRALRLCRRAATRARHHARTHSPLHLPTQPPQYGLGTKAGKCVACEDAECEVRNSRHGGRGGLSRPPAGSLLCLLAGLCRAGRAASSINLMASLGWQRPPPSCLVPTTACAWPAHPLPQECDAANECTRERRSPSAVLRRRLLGSPLNLQARWQGRQSLPTPAALPVRLPPRPLQSAPAASAPTRARASPGGWVAGSTGGAPRWACWSGRQRQRGGGSPACGWARRSNVEADLPLDAPHTHPPNHPPTCHAALSTWRAAMSATLSRVRTAPGARVRLKQPAAGAAR